MKNTLIVFLVIIVALLAFVAFKPKTAPVIPSTTSQVSTTTPPVEQPQNSAWKTYSSTLLGFSFKYPSDWKLTEDTAHKQVTIATNDVGEVVEGHSFPSYSLSFKSTDKTFFSKPINTKWGVITYDANRNAVLADGNCLKPDPLSPSAEPLSSPSIQYFRYGGSLMSDPAYSDAAIVTTNYSIIIIHSEQGVGLPTPLQDQVDRIKNSFNLLNGNKVFVPTCATI